jgi:hypothetical protein
MDCFVDSLLNDNQWENIYDNHSNAGEYTERFKVKRWPKLATTFLCLYFQLIKIQILSKPALVHFFFSAGAGAGFSGLTVLPVALGKSTAL